MKRKSQNLINNRYNSLNSTERRLSEGLFVYTQQWRAAETPEQCLKGLEQDRIRHRVQSQIEQPLTCTDEVVELCLLLESNINFACI